MAFRFASLAQAVVLLSAAVSTLRVQAVEIPAIPDDDPAGRHVR
jgi:hypothetical protein